MNPELVTRLESLPDAPGVYLMKDAAGAVFYVGKAKSLRDRLRQYVRGQDSRAFVALLDELWADVELILTENAKEALILENNLVKRLRPRFNVRLRDDKNFISLRLDVRAQYPRLEVVRRALDDGARYFGPYDSAKAIRDTLRLVNRHFQLRTCSDQMMRSRARPCLEHQLGRCPAPCVYDLTTSYPAHVKNLIAFLSGNHQELRADLHHQMTERAGTLEYEAAGRIRDQLRAIERSLVTQQVQDPRMPDRDVVGMHRQGPEVQIVVVIFRGGRLSHQATYALCTEISDEDVLSGFVLDYYVPVTEKRVPTQVLLPGIGDWAEALEEHLLRLSGRRVSVRVPKRGPLRRLVALASRNARQVFLETQRDQGLGERAALELQRLLHLPGPPRSLECIDISHWQGEHQVGSVVRTENGKPVRAGYRRLRIRGQSRAFGGESAEFTSAERGRIAPSQDDPRAIYEVVCRRLRHGKEDGDLPDLLVIDGGKGQLNAAQAAANDCGVDIALVALAKERRTEGEAKKVERVFLPDNKNAIALPENGAAFSVLVALRDEAHRFAISLQRHRRRRALKRSALRGTKGIGPKTETLLLRRFGSVAQAQEAPLAEWLALLGPTRGNALYQRVVRP